jgi:hypothetical protein
MCCVHPSAFKRYHSILVILSVIASRLKVEDVRTDFRPIETAVRKNWPPEEENRFIIIIIIIVVVVVVVVVNSIGLLPGGSGYFTCKQNTKLVTTRFKSGGLHEKHAVATWNVGNRLSICLDIGKPRKTCVEGAGRRTFRILTSSQQSGI